MSDRITLGLTEEIIIIGNNDKKQKLLARIDSGATVSSIDISIAEKLNLGPITRSRIVKSASGIGKRPMLKVKVKINGSILESEFTLADRSHMKFPVLIGQNLLKEGKFLIDPLKVMK